MTKRKESAKPLDMTYALSERIKELNCLYSIANIAARHNFTIDEIYQVGVDMPWLFFYSGRHSSRD